MSDIRKLINMINETTVAGAVGGGPAVPLGATHKRMEEEVEESHAPEVIEYGNWENSALVTGEKTKSSRPRSAKVVKSVYGEAEAKPEAEDSKEKTEAKPRKGIRESLEDVEESGLQAYLGNKKYGKAGMDALRKAGREGASKEKMAKIRAKYDKLDEEGMTEGSYDLHIPGSDKMSDEQRHKAILAKHPEATRVGKTPGQYRTKDGNLISNIKGVRKLANKEQGVGEAGFPGAPDVEMPPMEPSGDPNRDKLKQEYVDIHREIKSLVDVAYAGDQRAKARIKQLNARADQIKSILYPRQPPNQWQKDTYGYDDNWNIVKKGVEEGTGVTDYTPKSQGGTRKELLAKYHKTKSPKDAEAARKAGATQQELKGVSEAKLDEEDLIVNPAAIKKLSGLIAKAADRTDHEVQMARSDLIQAAKNAKMVYELVKNIPEEQGIEGWVQEKIIKAADYLNTVREYLESQHIENHGETQEQMACPKCGGPAFSDRSIAEAQDACYHKVKSRYKVWPSAYASGALVKCRKVGAKNWGSKS
jgi:hypothetical protein